MFMTVFSLIISVVLFVYHPSHVIPIAYKNTLSEERDTILNDGRLDNSAPTPSLEEAVVIDTELKVICFTH